MYRLILKDYLNRWMALYIVPCYAALAGTQGFFNEDVMLLNMSSITYFLYTVYFLNDLYVMGTPRIVQTLPVSQKVHSRLLWIEGTIVPIVLGWMVFIIGYIIIALTTPDKNSGWNQLSSHVLAWLWIGNGVFVFAAWFRSRDPNIPVLIKSLQILTVIAYISAWFFASAYKKDGELLQYLLPAAALLMVFVSYLAAPRFLQNSISQKKAKSLAEIPRRVLKGQDTSISLWDRWLSHPMIAVSLGSMILIVLSMLLFYLEKVVYQTTTSVTASLTVVGVIVVTFITLFWKYSTFLGTLKLFTSLPVSRNSIFFSYLVLPAIVFFPVAVLPWIGFKIEFYWYFTLYAFTLMNNALYLCFGPIAALTSLTGAGFAIQVGLFMQHKYKESYDSLLDLYLPYILLVPIIIAMVIWTWYLLTKSNAPFRKKPSLGIGCS